MEEEVALGLRDGKGKGKGNEVQSQKRSRDLGRDGNREKEKLMGEEMGVMAMGIVKKT